MSMKRKGLQFPGAGSMPYLVGNSESNSPTHLEGCYNILYIIIWHSSHPLTPSVKSLWNIISKQLPFLKPPKYNITTIHYFINVEVIC